MIMELGNEGFSKQKKTRKRGSVKGTRKISQISNQKILRKLCRSMEYCVVCDKSWPRYFKPSWKQELVQRKKYTLPTTSFSIISTPKVTEPGK